MFHLHQLLVTFIFANFLFVVFTFTLKTSCHAGSWDDVFKVAVALYLIGTLIWNVFSTGEKILD